MHNVVYAPNIVYALTYIDYPTVFNQPQDVKERFNNMRDNGLAGVANHDPRVLMESDITFAGYPGRFLRIKLLRSGNFLLTRSNR